MAGASRDKEQAACVGGGQLLRTPPAAHCAPPVSCRGQETPPHLPLPRGSGRAPAWRDGPLSSGGQGPGLQLWAGWSRLCRRVLLWMQLQRSTLRQHDGPFNLGFCHPVSSQSARQCGDEPISALSGHWHVPCARYRFSSWGTGPNEPPHAQGLCSQGPTCHLHDAMPGHVVERVTGTQRGVLAIHGHR